MEKKKLNIDIKKIVKTALQRKWLFVKVWVITFVLSCVWILPQPRYYTSEVSIAPESTDMKDAGSLASLASSFGVSLGNGSGDAIYPQLYPDLFASTQFMVSLMDIQVQTMEGDVNTDYFTYLKDYQQKNILFEPIRLVVNWAKSFFEKGEPSIPGKDGQRFDPFHLRCGHHHRHRSGPLGLCSVGRQHQGAPAGVYHRLSHQEVTHRLRAL